MEENMGKPDKLILSVFVLAPVPVAHQVGPR